MRRGSDGCRWLWSAIALLATGCAVPDYHMPHGFSSSYYRHLQRGQPTILSPQPLQQPNSVGLPRTYQSLEMTPPLDMGPQG